ncbi:MAG: biotin--[acetyl-CoA-carboxylase] ligase [Alphaproteobacteria bacterium]|nr:biotin--[acetyl-CoA-carboxylase] ligase [Alphaproteobacteria bacterium]
MSEAAGAHAGWRLAVHECLQSTNDTAIAAAEAGEPGGLAVLALEQTAGRGRHGRAWASARGNLHLSVLLRPAQVAHPGQWAILAGLAAAETLADLLPAELAPRLKWPNDLLVDGAKIGGVLVETAPGNGAPASAWVVIGIGLNLAAHPDDAARPATSLAALGIAPPPPRRVASALLDAIARWRMVLDHAGFAPLAAAWCSRGPAMGEVLSVRLPRGAVQGRFAGLDADGALVVETGTGRTERITGGEVFPATPATAPAKEAADAARG